MSDYKVEIEAIPLKEVSPEFAQKIYAELYNLKTIGITSIKIGIIDEIIRPPTATQIAYEVSKKLIKELDKKGCCQ